MSSINRILLWTTVVSVALLLYVRSHYQKIQTEAAQIAAYGALVERIHYERLDYEQQWKETPARRPQLLEAARDYLYQTLADSIFDHWYGTPWDFNGTTQQPKVGAIACGYFVTTTLEQPGFSLPRRRLAQQAASVIIRTLCQRSSIAVFHALDDLHAHMLQQPEGLYLVGLDTHVGYLWRHPEGWHMVHASYSGGKAVAAEPWDASTVLQKSKLFVVGDLLGHDALVRWWIEGQPIQMSS